MVAEMKDIAMRFFKYSLLIFTILLLQGLPAIAQDRQPVLQIGRGEVDSIEWHPRGTYVMVSSVTGAWIYTDTLEDVAHIPNLQLATISPDGKYIVGTQDGEMIQLWDALTFEFIREEKPTIGKISQFDWSPDSRHLAVTSYESEYYRVRIVDINFDAGEQIRVIHQRGSVNAIQSAWNADGQYIALMDSQSGRLHIYDVKNDELAVDNIPEEHRGTITWSSCNHLLRIQHGAQPIFTMWDMNTGIVTSPDYFTWQTLFSPKGCYFISSNVIGNVANTPQNILIEENSYNGSNAIWRPNGRMIAFIHRYDRNNQISPIHFVDLSGEVVYQFDTDHQLRQLIWHPSQDYVLVHTANNTLIAYHLKEERVTGELFAHQAMGNVIDWHTEKPILAVSDFQGRVEIWDSITQENLNTYDYRKNITGFVWQPHGDYLATYFNENWNNISDNTVHVIDTAQSQSESPIYSYTLPDGISPTSIDWHPNGHQLAIGHSQERVQIWDIISDSIIDEVILGDAKNLGSQLQWSPDGESIAVPYWVTGGGGAVALYNVEIEEYVDRAFLGATWAWTEGNQLNWLHWHSYGCGGYSPPWIEANLYQADWENSIPLVGMADSIEQGFISPDGQYGMALDNDKNGIVWNLRTADIQFMLSEVEDLMWSDDSQRLAVLRTDGRIMILNEQGTIIEHFQANKSLVPDYFDSYVKGYRTLHWSADAQYLAHRHDGVVDVWELESDISYGTFSQVRVIIHEEDDQLITLLGISLVLASLMGIRLLSVKRWNVLEKQKRNISN